MSPKSYDLSEVHATIQQARADGLSVLSEYASKQLLATCGLPVVPERLCQNAAEARAAAQELGYPVVAKACGPNLAHKSERNLVRVGLRSAERLAAALAEMSDELAGETFDGFLIQAMVPAKREIIVGGLRDAVFGPCVMLGVGGIAAEALGDVAFRLAPIERRDALEMVEELQARKVLGPFRGDPEIDLDVLCGAIAAVARLLCACPEVAEVDVNPMRIKGGRPVAVDALITLGDPLALETHESPPVNEGPERFKALFEPQSLAIIGATTSPVKWGFRILFNTLEGGYTGRLYGVNPNYDTILGVPCHPSVAALPEAVDLALIVVPPKGVMGALRDCADKGVKVVVIITAGFGETSVEGAKAAQDEIERFARETGLLVVGPNCAGLSSPAPMKLYSGMISRYPRAGGLSIASQSGNVGSTVLTWANLHQIGIGRFISSGNEAVTSSADYLDFLAEDPVTESIISYVEGMREGRRFFEALSHAARKKPVVVIKGGRSGAGQLAAKSHTGALATPNRLFNAVCRQAGAVVVDDFYHAMEVAEAFVNIPLPKGRRVGIVSQGGGWGVMAADACSEAGLDVVPLPDETMAELDAILPGWWSRNNPVDLVAGNDMKLVPRTIEIVLRSPAVDAVIMLGVGYIASASLRFAHSELAKSCGLDKLAAMGCELDIADVQRMAELVKEYNKPILVASDTVLLAYGPGEPNPAIAELERQGLYAFADFTNAAEALAAMAERYEFLNGIVRTREV